ncbi:MAG: hypothetical protein JWN62_1812 [Acidimicrobiales bacterium]|nr:hypothetical protein [Acidimicrobiales bacterium]
MHLGHYLALLRNSQRGLIEAYRAVADAHPDEPDVHITCRKFAEHTERHEALLAPMHARYAEQSEAEPEHLLHTLFHGPRSGPLELLRDLHDLYLATSECDICWTLIIEAARGARDTALLDLATACGGEVAIQLAWLRSRMEQAAPQALVVAQ